MEDIVKHMLDSDVKNIDIGEHSNADCNSEDDLEYQYQFNNTAIKDSCE